MSIPVKAEGPDVPGSVTALYNDVACYAIESGRRVRIRYDVGHHEGGAFGGALSNSLDDTHTLSIYVDPEEDTEEEDAEDGSEE